MQEGLTRENKMGVMPVGKLLMSMSLPIMVSMLIQALYNIVDSMFVARISEDALTAVSLAFPIQNLMIAVATGTGVGMNSLLSKALGAKDFDRSNRAATNGLFVLVLSCVPFMLFGGLLTDWFMRTQTDIAHIITYGDEYLRVVCIVSIGSFGAVATERLLRATGKTVYLLDEPTTGLHKADVDKLIQVLQRLTDAGNSVLVIEHNLDVIKVADWLIDLGPEGGDEGGTLVCAGTPEEVAQCEGSYTGQYLKKILK